MAQCTVTNDFDTAIGTICICPRCHCTCSYLESGFDVNFYVLSIDWPLLSKWSQRRDLNPQRADYKSAALPIELRRQENNESNYNTVFAKLLNVPFTCKVPIWLSMSTSNSITNVLGFTSVNLNVFFGIPLSVPDPL